MHPYDDDNDERDLLPEEMCSNCGEGVVGMQVEYVCNDSHCQECCDEGEGCFN